MPNLLQLLLDSRVAPRRVLICRADNESSDALHPPGAARALLGWLGPLRRNQSTVPAHQHVLDYTVLLNEVGDDISLVAVHEVRESQEQYLNRVVSAIMGPF